MNTVSVAAWPSILAICLSIHKSIQHLIWSIFVAISIIPSVANAQSSTSQIVIGNDFGGLIWNRMVRLRDIHTSGQSVRIDGAICFSTCTMYLGVANVCISSDTVFGFHGPTATDRQLRERDVDFLSTLIASYYPPALRAWYLQTGRYSTNRIYRIQGSELIRLGLPSC